jgi:hypothetical protein
MERGWATLWQRRLDSTSSRRATPKDLWHAAQQGYSLDPMIGVRKFGPHHVVMKTPLSNIRLTTFFAGESEVKIIDPSRLSLVEAVGCAVEFIPPMEWTTK